MSFVFGKNSTNGTVTWQSEPSTRGTWSILSTCIITISLCLWTAVHLNIPPPNQKHAQYWWKLYWLGIGLLAPELVAYMAWYQRMVAVKGLKDIQDAIGQQPRVSWLNRFWDWYYEQRTLEEDGETESETPISDAKNKWTMTHAFYAYMGGFALDSSGTDNPILPPGHEQMRLTLKGVVVALRLRPELLKNFPVDTIIDKSKASPLAKAIVCFQAVWFCVQCLERIIQSAPISLLELNTFAHCIFALSIYIQWWHKPLDIATPTLIRGETARELLAWMSMHMPMNELALSKDERCEARRIRLVDRDDPYFRQISRSRVAKQNGVQESIGVALNSNNLSRKCIALADLDEFLSTGLCYYDEGEAACFSPSWFVILKPMDIERWKCAAVLLKETLSSGTCADYDGLLMRSEPDWRPIYERRASLGVAICIAFVCVECMYGGLHALAWNSDFRTAQETYLWHFAVVFIVAFGPAAMVFFVISNICGTEECELEAIQKPKQGPMPGRVDYILLRALGVQINRLTALCGYGRGPIFFLLCYLHGLARASLTVECLIALFNSQPGVFEESSWSAYFPHIN